MSIKKGRQMGKVLKDIRQDHVERYLMAARFADDISAVRVADIGAGFGYGSFIIAKETNAFVVGYEIDQEAVDFANLWWAHDKVSRVQLDVSKHDPCPADLFVAFEILEHFAEAPEFLKRASKLTPYLIGSVPNEDIVPFGGKSVHPQHVRHYTFDELREELKKAGWWIETIGSQLEKRGKKSKVSWGCMTGRTLVFVARSENT